MEFNRADVAPASKWAIELVFVPTKVGIAGPDGRTSGQEWKVRMPWLAVIREQVEARIAREITWLQRDVAAGRIAKDVVPLRIHKSRAVLGEVVISVTREYGVLQNRCCGTKSGI